jgi:hypothetical protein
LEISARSPGAAATGQVARRQITLNVTIQRDPNSPASNQEAKEAHKEAANISEHVVEEIAADGLVKHVTNRLGIRTCGKCHERRSQDATIQYTVNHGLILSVG